jgi:hypothetical protein
MSLMLDLKELLSEILLGSFDMMLSLGTCDILFCSFYILNTSFGRGGLATRRCLYHGVQRGHMVWETRTILRGVQNSARDLHGSKASS